MAKSLVQFRGNGFWLSNGVLQVLLHYAAADLQLTPDCPSWMNNLVAHWRCWRQ
jgi:hypothetical protein